MRGPMLPSAEACPGCFLAVCCARGGSNHSRSELPRSGQRQHGPLAFFDLIRCKRQDHADVKLLVGKDGGAFTLDVVMGTRIPRPQSRLNGKAASFLMPQLREIALRLGPRRPSQSGPDVHRGRFGLHRQVNGLPHPGRQLCLSIKNIHLSTGWAAKNGRALTQSGHLSQVVIAQSFTLLVTC